MSINRMKELEMMDGSIQDKVSRYKYDMLNPGDIDESLEKFGLKAGMQIPEGTIMGIFQHDPTGQTWMIVVTPDGRLYEVWDDTDYDGPNDMILVAIGSKKLFDWRTEV